MKFLLYCLLRSSNGSECPLDGVKGRNINFVAADKITAAYSELDEPDTSAELDDIRSYMEVIQYFHGLGPVVPMRYGTLFYSRDEIREALFRERDKYLTILAEVEDRDEISIKMILSNLNDSESFGVCSNKPESVECKSLVSGTNYLAGRRKLYMQRKLTDRLAESIFEDVSRRFEGLFTKARFEIAGPNPKMSTSHATLLSFHFLVPRIFLPAFVKMFGEVKSASPHKMLLSGPWPPYNFVSPTTSPNNKKS